jgi:alkanesulfonate monooxygenase SsuD/methylene tetrahydromethanopterin reductase-like flavin-dependent oxidoreductase (luciferase family)
LPVPAAVNVHVGITGLQRGIDHPEPLLTVVEEADRLGYDSVWFNEQHFAVGIPGAPSAMLLAAAVFARTKRIRVGLSVVVLPMYHPVMLAQLVELSGGRLDVGIGRGSSPGLSKAMPEDARRRGFEEAYRLLLAVWKQPYVSADGDIWRFQDVPVGMRPAEIPPLSIAGTSRESIELAVRDGLRLLLSLEPPEARQLEILDEVRRDLGVSGPRLTSSSRYVCIAPTAAGAEAQARELWGRITENRREIARQRGVAPTDRPFELFRQDQLISGDPDAVIAAIDSLIRSQGLDHLRCVFNGNGAVNLEQTLQRMRLFAVTVLPERERRWSPDPVLH